MFDSSAADDDDDDSDSFSPFFAGAPLKVPWLWLLLFVRGLDRGAPAMSKSGGERRVINK